MNGFWKKKLPAFLLALIMIVGLAPAALAEEAPCEHEDSYKRVQAGAPGAEDTVWCPTCSKTYKVDHKSDGRSDRTVREATCNQLGIATFTCKFCGNTIEKSIPMTSHSYKAEWSSDNTSHWHACSTPGCTARGDVVEHTPQGKGDIKPPTCTTAGSVKYVCAVCEAPFTEDTSPALGHNWVNGTCSRCGTQHTPHVDSNQDGLCDTCNFRMSASSFTVTFYTGSGTSSESVAKGGYPKTSTPSMPSVPGNHSFQGWVSGACRRRSS